MIQELSIPADAAIQLLPQAQISVWQLITLPVPNVVSGSYQSISQYHLFGRPMGSLVILMVLGLKIILQCIGLVTEYGS